MSTTVVGHVEADPANVTVDVDPSGDLAPITLRFGTVSVALSMSCMEALRDQLDPLRRCLSCEIRLATYKVGPDWLCSGCALVGEVDAATEGLVEPAEEDR